MKKKLISGIILTSIAFMSLFACNKKNTKNTVTTNTTTKKATSTTKKASTTSSQSNNDLIEVKREQIDDDGWIMYKETTKEYIIDEATNTKKLKIVIIKYFDSYNNEELEGERVKYEYALESETMDKVNYYTYHTEYYTGKGFYLLHSECIDVNGTILPITDYAYCFSGEKRFPYMITTHTYDSNYDKELYNITETYDTTSGTNLQLYTKQIFDYENRIITEYIDGTFDGYWRISDVYMMDYMQPSDELLIKDSYTYRGLHNKEHHESIAIGIGDIKRCPDDELHEWVDNYYYYEKVLAVVYNLSDNTVRKVLCFVNDIDNVSYDIYQIKSGKLNDSTSYSIENRTVNLNDFDFVETVDDLRDVYYDD